MNSLFSPLYYLKVAQWIQKQWFLLIVGFLFIFIPLYPKLPLLEILPNYRVRLRLEDVLVVVATLVLVKESLSKKLHWKHQLWKLMFLYLGVGLLSILSAVFITKTVPMISNHVLKSILHLARYTEYFLLSFLLFAAVKTRAEVQWLLKLLSGTVLLVALYGLGQKLFSWPLVSTMLREFSTGQILYLTEGARVQSTFAGHYDLAAFMVITTPFILAWFLTSQRFITKIYLSSVLLFSIWIVIESASRISFVAYVVGLLSVPVFLKHPKKTWLQHIHFSGITSLILLITLIVMMGLFGSQLQQRFLQIVRVYEPVYTAYRQLFPEVELPNDNVLTPTDTRPIPYPPDQKPVDVIVDVPDLVTTSTVSATGEVVTIIEEKNRVFSSCAQNKSLSLCIRLEELWPQAMASFWKNPVFGTGYGTLNKKNVTEFTEAESTDNNFLRTLGETGLLGFITFYGLTVAVCFHAFRVLKTSTTAEPIAAAIIAATIGILINAFYIDVFAASKVAFTYWGLVGLALGYFNYTAQSWKSKNGKR